MENNKAIMLDNMDSLQNLCELMKSADLENERISSRIFDLCHLVALMVKMAFEDTSLSCLASILSYGLKEKNRGLVLNACLAIHFEVVRLKAKYE